MSEVKKAARVTGEYVCTALCYRQDRLFEPGEHIFLNNEIPSKTMVPVEKAAEKTAEKKATVAPKAATAAPAPSVRPSDKPAF